MNCLPFKQDTAYSMLSLSTPIAQNNMGIVMAMNRSKNGKAWPGAMTRQLPWA
jgi:hypothetical protein